MTLTQNVLLNPSTLNNVQILAVDNDRDSGALYRAVLEEYGVEVTTTESIKETLACLHQFIPDILICEARFLGESVQPLLYQVRAIAKNNHKIIPIFVISTYPVINLAEYFKVKVEAYQIKPVNIDQFIDQVCKLALLSKVGKPFSIQDCLVRLNVGEVCCGTEVR